MRNKNTQAFGEVQEDITLRVEYSIFDRGKTPVEIPLHLEHILSPHQKLFHFPVGKLHDDIMSGTTASLTGRILSAWRETS